MIKKRIREGGKGIIRTRISFSVVIGSSSEERRSLNDLKGRSSRAGLGKYSPFDISPRQPKRNLTTIAK